MPMNKPKPKAVVRSARAAEGGRTYTVKGTATVKGKAAGKKDAKAVQKAGDDRMTSSPKGSGGKSAYGKAYNKAYKVGFAKQGMKYVKKK